MLLVKVSNSIFSANHSLATSYPAKISVPLLIRLTVQFTVTSPTSLTPNNVSEQPAIQTFQKCFSPFHLYHNKSLL